MQDKLSVKEYEDPNRTRERKKDQENERRSRSEIQDWFGSPMVVTGGWKR